MDRSTCDVDVFEKSKIFEEKIDENENRQKVKRIKFQNSNNLTSTTRSSRENWNNIRDKHCPITASLVNENKGESLRSSILVSEEKTSWKNLKFTKQSVENCEKELKTEITSTKEFEDKATKILNQMRKQRRTLQMEYVAKVSVPSPKKVTGWRDKLSNKENTQNKTATSASLSNNNSSHQMVKAVPEAKIKRNKATDKNCDAKLRGKVEVKSLESTMIQENAAPPQIKFTNPLDFILMREEFVKSNPPPKKFLVRQRSVESDSEGESSSMESVMRSLKKIVKAINPKREFPQDKIEKERQDKKKKEEAEKATRAIRDQILKNTSASKWDERMKKYHGANIVPYNRHASRWNSCQDLIEDQKVIDKKAVRERIKNRVLSSCHQVVQKSIEENFCYCEIEDFPLRGKQHVKVSEYKFPRLTVEQIKIPIFECVEFRKRELPDIIAHFSKDKEKTKKKSFHVKPTLHGVTDNKTDRYIFALVTRSDACWETTKPINVAVKIKTELFAPKTNPVVKVKAKISFESLKVASIICAGTSGTTAYCEQHKWDGLKGCALFSIVGETNQSFPVGREVRRLVLNLPVEAVLGEEVHQGEQVFTKCERKPQSQLVKVSCVGTSPSNTCRCRLYV